MRRLVVVPAACQCLKSMTMRNDEWPLDKALVCMKNNVCDWDPVRKRFVDNSGFPRTLDRSVKLLGTRVRY